MAASKSGFAYEVVRTNRRVKTASIKVIDGQVQVIVPAGYSAEGVESLLRNKALWIREKCRIQAERIPVKPKEYVSGECFTYLGKNYRLKLTEGGCEVVKLQGGYFVLGVDKGLSGARRDRFLREQFEVWYKDHALKRLREKVNRYVRILGVAPKSVSVKTYKSRWGGCSVTGDISFNWKVIMAPHYIVDYVVVHELNHMKEHNHSPRFWHGVERVIPDYRDRKEWLKNNGDRLGIE